MSTTASRHPSNSHAFNVVPRAQIPRSAFNRSHNIKTTLQSAGYLYPFFIEDMVPGDTVKLRATLMARLATPIWPIMDNMFIDVFWFSCSERILWDNFKRMMGEQDNPADSTSYVFPVVRSPANGFARGGMADYFGIPPQHSATTGGATLDVRAAPFRMYNRIFKDWFRDENIQDSPVINTGNGPDAESDYPLRRRGKRKDYFSGSLPWPQKGTAVVLPLGSTAPVNFTFTGSPVMQDASTIRFGNFEASAGVASPGINIDADGAGNWAAGEAMFWKDLGFTATTNLATATAATINQIRTAFQIQRLYERDARGGTRYPEQILTHFGVVSDDARQQRPEFLGGGTLNVNINVVAGTNQDPGSTGPDVTLGRLAAFGTVVGGIPTVTKSFTEHSWVMGLVMIRADINYQQGLARMWSKQTKVDVYWPVLAMLGEQAVLSKEIYVDGTSGDDTVWGYQERWAEMRYKNNIITGKMRSSDPQTLDAWHLALNFISRPLLNNTFIQENPPITRVIAVQTEPAFILDGAIEFIHVRPMPTFSVPGLVDHL